MLSEFHVYVHLICWSDVKPVFRILWIEFKWFYVWILHVVYNVFLGMLSYYQGRNSTCVHAAIIEKLLFYCIIIQTGFLIKNNAYNANQIHVSNKRPEWYVEILIWTDGNTVRIRVLFFDWYK